MNRAFTLHKCILRFFLINFMLLLLSNFSLFFISENLVLSPINFSFAEQAESLSEPSNANQTSSDTSVNANNSTNNTIVDQPIDSSNDPATENTTIANDSTINSDGIANSDTTTDSGVTVDNKETLNYAVTQDNEAAEDSNNTEDSENEVPNINDEQNTSVNSTTDISPEFSMYDATNYRKSLFPRLLITLFFLLPIAFIVLFVYIKLKNVVY